MYELKTKQNDANVEAFLNSVEDERKRADSFTMLELMERVTGEPARMWGSAIIGFGTMHYKYASGQQGDWPPVGFSPRKQSISVYLMSGFELLAEELKRLGKHKLGKGCLYINRLSDVDMGVLEEMVRKAFAVTKEQQQDVSA